MSFDTHISLKFILEKMNNSGKLRLDLMSGRDGEVLSQLISCHSPVHGFTISECPTCHQSVIHFGSCNNPNCPECGFLRREEWMDKIMEKCVRAKAWHIIFTVPDKYFYELFRQDPKDLYSILFKAQAKALKTISRDPKYFGAESVGFFSTLHSWGSDLIYHPHIHTCFFGAGLDRNGNLVRVTKDFLFPAKKLAALFKKYFLKLCSKYETSHSPWLNDLNSAKKVSWNVQICPPLESPESIVRYLARYVNRTAISNSRLKGYDGERIRFEYKDYRDHNKIKTRVMSDREFIRRFREHIPPKNFSRFRYYGFMSFNSKELLKTMKQLTNTPDYKRRTREEIIESLGSEFISCKKCKDMLVVIKRVPRMNPRMVFTMAIARFDFFEMKSHVAERYQMLSKKD